MKYGLVVYKDTDNIGDDIQSYVAMKFLPRIDYIIDRERLDLFVPNNNEQVATIMNGWYMHNKYNWPPSPYIYPLYISVHFTMRDYLQIGYQFLEGKGKEHLKQYEPIGCRDESTMEALRNIGVDSYLSGCMTLTLNKQDDIAETANNYICLVDVDNEIIEKVNVFAKDIEVKLITHDIDSTINSALSWEERVQRVKDLLKIYQNAKCVITSRLHCALPCLAINTPVLLIRNSENDDRFSNFFDFLHVCTKEKYISGSFSYDITDPLPNKNKHLETRIFIEEKCKNFLEYVKDYKIVDKYIPEISDYKKLWINNATWQKQLIMNKTNEYLYCMDNYVSYINELKEGKQWIESQWNNEKTVNNGLKKYINEVEDGKTWLQEQWNNEKTVNNELKKYITEVEDGKAWLQEQWDNEKRVNNELKEYIKEVEEAKKWLKEQWDNEIFKNDNIQNDLIKAEDSINLLNNNIDKLKYKYNRLKEDPLIKKVIKFKKYEE